MATKRKLVTMSVLPLPDFKRFCKSSKKDPCAEFCLWVCKQLKIPVDKDKELINNTAILISEKASVEFKKCLTAWVKRTRKYNKEYAERVTAFHWFQYSPAEFNKTDIGLDPAKVYVTTERLLAARDR